ncbi:PorP/SprF family type IX secretion system membrane protein [Sanyastnella coralliicola]|uniref:PorP/SprF family type IX secretion system membrane protein n=1 Tax=Sanyastnella coralliicola TaxID=3069118 RepID=UPI0027B8DE91|nr:type IX secretion system membrane protein PorP/SprF [Longitalea sp. SCSIO 12813]
MKKILLLLAVFFLASLGAEAQQLSRRTQFINNTYLMNPAVAGTKLYSPITVSYRNQWAGFDGAPQTYLLSGHTGLPNRIGVGAIFFHDDTGGAISRTGAELTGSYQIDLNNEDAVSFGLSAVLSQFAFDGSDLEVFDQNDQALVGTAESTFNFDANFGMMVYGPNYFFGFSVPQLIQTKLGIDGFLEDENQNIRHFNFMGSYLYYFNEDFSIQPSVLTKFTGSSPVQLDVLMKAAYQEMVWAGVTYRHNDAVALSVGYEYDRYAVAYSYDITTSDAANLSPHTHEISLSYYIPRAGRGFSEKSLLGKRILSRRRVVK